MANTPRLGRTEQRTRMVVGFAFNPQLTRLALIRKNREPEGAVMIDTCNGLGGKCHVGETYWSAMIREFEQEAGVLVPTWQHIAISEGDSWRLYIYAAKLHSLEWRRVKMGDKSVTDEQVISVNPRRLPSDVYPDLRFIVPLALAKVCNDGPPAVTRFDWRDI